MGGGHEGCGTTSGTEDQAAKRDLLSVDEPAYGGSCRRLSSSSAYDGQEEGLLSGSRREGLDTHSSSRRITESSVFMSSEEPPTSPMGYGLNSPLRSRDATIEPPDLFNTNKKELMNVRGEMAAVRGQIVEGGRKVLKASVDMRSNSWDNKENNNSKSYETHHTTQTLHRKSKSSSQSRSKRMRNRSLEMVLDDPTTDSSATKRYTGS